MAMSETITVMRPQERTMRTENEVLMRVVVVGFMLWSKATTVSAKNDEQCIGCCWQRFDTRLLMEFPADFVPGDERETGQILPDIPQFSGTFCTRCMQIRQNREHEWKSVQINLPKRNPIDPILLWFPATTHLFDGTPCEKSLAQG